MSSQGELDGIFDNVNDLEVGLGEAAQQIAQQNQTPPQEALPQSHQPIQKTETVSPPPSEPLETPQQKELKKYDEEKKKLFDMEEQLFKLSHSDSSGIIVRNFGLSQIVLKVGEEVDRLNGLIVLRSLKARCKSVKLCKDGEGNKQSTEVLDREELADCMYEVWGTMEDGSVGLTSSYSPSMVLCVISLKSGYDLPPEMD